MLRKDLPVNKNYRSDIRTLIGSTKPRMSTLPGGYEPKVSELPFIYMTKVSGKLDVYPDAFLLTDVLSADTCDDLVKLMSKAGRFEPVSVQGNKDVKDERVGSKRVTMWSPELALRIWGKMSRFFSDRVVNEFTATDWWQGGFEGRRNWEPFGLSPLLRFMQYEKSGQHYSHYDAGFVYPDPNYRTLMSVVIYLTTNETGGTRLVRDGQVFLPIWDRDHSDWTRETKESEVITEVLPSKGSIFVFDHRLCHDVAVFDGPSDRFPNDRVIIRGDVIFKAT